MATENKSKPNNSNKDSKKRKQRYLPHNKSVKKGGYPLRPGVQGFFITCDGGRERQASHEAMNVLDSFYEELVHGTDSDINTELPNKPPNKKTKFTYFDSDDDEDDINGQKDEEGDKDKSDTDRGREANHKSFRQEISNSHEVESLSCENHIIGDKDDVKEDDKCNETQEVEAEALPAKKQCLEPNASKSGRGICYRTEKKSIDKLIEAELEELKDKSKRRFIYLDSGCNGVVFVQMLKRDGDPSPKDIAQHMIESVARTRKHMSRFILRVLPVEVSCYASEEEISRAIKPLIEQHFPVETQTPLKFAVLYEARANTGVERMKIINTVAKSVPGPHNVNLNNPDKNIVVQIARTVCLIGVVEKYKELAKYNLRQLTSSNQ